MYKINIIILNIFMMKFNFSKHISPSARASERGEANPSASLRRIAPTIQLMATNRKQWLTSKWRL